MLKLVIDNSDKYFDPLLEMYVDDIPIEFPYTINDESDDVMAMFKTPSEAMQYQMGMGIRASTTIELWKD